MSQIRIVDNQGNEVVKTPQEIALSPQVETGLPEGFMDEMAVSQVVGLENDSDRAKYKEEIQNLIKWAKLEGYDSPQQLKWMVRQLQDRLGTPPLTESWITRLNRYAVIALQQKRLEDEQSSLMKGFDSDPGQ